MQDGLGLYLKDLYPNMTGSETSTNVQPDPEDKDSMNEESAEAEKVDTHYSSKRNVFLGILIFVCMVVFFGTGGE